ncbi:hypothetical protein [Rahnella inusitata]|uniref:hypothetical protein n=1 Tax=Rahnella inusitata TaxID=58169 RepID=UPI0039B07A57
MSNKERIERERQRIALTYIEYCHRNFGGSQTFVALPSKKLPVVVEISELSLSQIMINHIERLVYEVRGLKEGEQAIIDTYAAMFDSMRGKLTPSGHDFIKEMMADAVTEALQNPKHSDLQMVS